MSPVFLSDTLYFQIGTSSVTTGAATNADSTPTISVEEDGVLMGYAPTVTNITTGIYRVQVDCTAGNGFEAGKRYSMYAVATVGGVTGRDGVGEFEVLAVDLNTGVASVTGNVDGNVTGAVGSVTGLTAANLDVAVSSRLATAGYTAPDNATIATIVARTDVATSTRAAPGDDMGLSSAAIDAIWDEVIDAGYTGRELIRGFASALLSKLSGAPLAPVFRDVGNVKNRITATTDADGNRTAVTLDLT